MRFLLLSLLFSLVYPCVADSLTLRGEWQQGGIIRGQIAPGSQLMFMGHAVKVSEAGHFVLGLGRDAPARVVLTVIDAEGNNQQLPFSVKSREYRIQRVNGVPQKTVTPPKEVLNRIHQEASQVAQARSEVTDRQDYWVDFQWPLIGPVTGVYGSQRVYNGVPKSPHYGVDVAQPTGTRVVAPASGKVVLTHNDMYYSGGTLIVDHGQGLSSTFIHLSKILVAVGDVVEQGQPIAEVGASGRASGPHLDWRMNWMDQRVDPQTLVPPMPSPTTTGQ